MAKSFPPGDPSDDPLALFGAESEQPKGKAAPKPPRADEAPLTAADADPAIPAAGGPSTVRYPTADAFNKITASMPERTFPAMSDLGVEFIGPNPPAGAVSFDHVCSVKGLGFVEGVALIQAAAEAVDAAGEGVPEVHSLFLTQTGNVVIHGASTGEPPARELTRLLHQMVAPNLMPPAGRLFVGRWINSDARSLTEFMSELAYFARPNGRELLVALHARCDGPRTSLTEIRPSRPRQTARPTPPAEPADAPKPKAPLLLWIAAHKRELAMGAVVIVAAVSLTAAATLLFAPGTLEASKEQTTASETATLADEPTSGVSDSKNARKRRSSGSADGPKTANRNRAGVASLAPGRPTGSQSPPSAIESQDATATLAQPPAVIALQSRTVPDLRVYSVSDSGVEPPRLRSAEIPELLIAGFEKRTNEVELVISEDGEVQQARMIKAPQRMPDIMLLSRAKELRFDPATRNGIPVRYKLVLSWNVTP